MFLLAAMCAAVVANACRVKHLAYRTEQAYVGWVKRFILFHNKRHPSEMGANEARAFVPVAQLERGEMFPMATVAVTQHRRSRGVHSAELTTDDRRLTF